jgi:hypothetical protein
MIFLRMVQILLTLMSKRLYVKSLFAGDLFQKEYRHV